MTELSPMRISRRGFLRGATAFSGFAAFAPALLKPGAAAAAANTQVMSGSHWGVFRRR